jgi:hypothetical protein
MGAFGDPARGNISFLREPDTSLSETNLGLETSTEGGKQTGTRRGCDSGRSSCVAHHTCTCVATPRRFAAAPTLRLESVNVNDNRTAQRIRTAIILAVTLATVLTAGILPTCGDGACCVLGPAQATVHAQMPCCASMTAPRDVPRPGVVTTSAGSLVSPQTWAPVALVMRPYASGSPSRVQATLTTVPTAHPEPTPPIFLLNAQFLI